MDGTLDFLDHDHPSPVTHYNHERSTRSGLTLVLPPLKGGKPLKSATKGKPRTAQELDTPIEKRLPRPVKLKPLKEILSKLISQIKKKDAYGFFLQPVDLSLVPGYLDIIKRPMDFGTISNKVDRGKYRSLEEFANDFRLVTENSKTFNPPGTIYHTEAERIEAWGLDHITKAASTVIQYETDWNIEVERDDDNQHVSIDDDDEPPTIATPMDVDEPGLGGPASFITPQTHTMSGRRTRGPYKKAGAHPNVPARHTISESIDAEGHLPGFKDGLGAFPAGSDWARMMLQLKLKGKKYKTKKERLRIEKDGPPTLPDGTLDYTEMEDPFSVLVSLVPEPLQRPLVTPTYPPIEYVAPPPPEYDPNLSSSHLTTPSSLPQRHHQFNYPQQEQQQAAGLRQSRSQPPSVCPSYPAPISVYNPFVISPTTLTTGTGLSVLLPTSSSSTSKSLPPFLLSPAATNGALSSTPTKTAAPSGTQRLKHWGVIRNSSSRIKGKEKEDDGVEQVERCPTWQAARELHPLDYGPLAFLASELAVEMNKQGVTGKEGEEDEWVRKQVRDSLVEKGQPPLEVGGTTNTGINATTTTSSVVNTPLAEIVTPAMYWSNQRAAEAEDYICETVYGGVDGLAYVRSLAEFVAPSQKDYPVYASCNPDLGVPLARWVEKNIVDELTEGRHALLRATASGLASMQHLREPPVPATLPLATLSPAMPLPTAQSSPPLPTHSFPASTSTSTSLPPPPVASAIPPRTNTPPPPSVLSQLPASLNAYPILTKAATTLLHIKTHKIDMSALIKAPGELFLSEEAWIGRDVIMARLKKSQSQSDLGSDVNSNTNIATNSSELEGSEELNRVLEGVAELVREMNGKIGGGGRERNGADAEEDKRAAKRRKLDSFSGHVSPDDVFPNPNFTPASIQATAAAATINGSGNGHANARAFAMKQEKEAKHRLAASPASPATPDTAEMSAATTPAPTPISTTFTASSSPAPTSPMSPSPSTPTAEPGVEEGPELRHLRLNLLALAKRAPLDTIAKLPKDLVPEHIRQYVPTLGV